MSDKEINKVIFAGETLVDLTADTVNPSALAAGYTAHDASGKSITGTFTETDPIFSASPAAGIKSADISNWNNKVDKVSGKGLSTNDYTTTEKNKLAGIAAGAEVNVQSDWNATTGDALILNKPTIPNEANVAWEVVSDYSVLTGDWAIDNGNGGNASICADADEVDDALAARPTFGDIVIESKTGSGKSVNANGTVQLTVSTTKSGYKCLGVLGWTLNGTNSHFCYAYEMNINDASNIVSGRFRNLATASTTLTLTARLLYIRA